MFKDPTAALSAADKGTSTGNVHANVFQPEKKRRHRDGYADGDYTLFRKANAGEFIRCQDAVAFLGTVNRIVFETDEEKEWLSLNVTTEEIKANCDDLKVLGKGDFKALMKWRIALREEVCSFIQSYLTCSNYYGSQIGLDVKTKPTEELTETVEIVEEVDEDQAIQEEVRIS